MGIVNLTFNKYNNTTTFQCAHILTLEKNANLGFETSRSQVGIDDSQTHSAKQLTKRYKHGNLSRE